MSSTQDKLKQALAEGGASVYYFASTETALLRQASRAALVALVQPGEEATRVDGPAPDMGQVLAAAGTISFFATRRVVEVREISVSAMGDKDVAELAELFGQLENAVLVVTALYKDKKAGTTKKAKALFEAAQKFGFAAELAKPTAKDNVRYLQAAARQKGAAFAPGAAEALLERAGDDRELLNREVDKLAAISGYGEISSALVGRYSVYNIEADVFELARLITAGRGAAAQQKLQHLFGLRHDPIAIAAALAGSFVDMYRVRTAPTGKTVKDVFGELGYKGNPYRLQKAKENAARYSPARLEECILLLYRLDRALKSSALPDKIPLVQTAVAELAGGGAG